MIIKICGITNLEDAELAIELGANALGFVMYPKSPRNISPLAVEEILIRLPREIMSVGVFVKNQTEHLNDGSWNAVQLHGFNRAQEIPATLKRTFIAASPKDLSRFIEQEIVIDESWGAGKTSNWQQLTAIKRSYILSGGLTPENVGTALRILKPTGVDISSGVERCPGVKDPKKLKSFIAAVQEFENRKVLS